MQLFKKKKIQNSPTKAQSLRCVPYKSDEVKENRGPDGEILLTYPVKAKPIFSRVIRAMGGATDGVTWRKLQLDSLGTSVWELLDGRRTVNAIILQFAKEHAVHPKEAEVSVTRFLYELGKRELIGLG